MTAILPGEGYQLLRYSRLYHCILKLLTVLAGLRIGYATNLWANLGTETQGVFNRTLEAIQAAGAVLLPFNGSAMVGYNDKYIVDPTFYTAEMGGAVSRCRMFTCVMSLLDDVAEQMMDRMWAALLGTLNLVWWTAFSKDEL